MTPTTSDLTGAFDEAAGARYGAPVVGRVYPSSRPCLVCEKPCATEGQLCPDCAAAGHRVTDDEVLVNITIDLPDWVWAEGRKPRRRVIGSDGASRPEKGQP